MKFSIGDIVWLKQTGEEGRVTAFLNDEMIEVETDGTHFPVFLDEVEHPYLNWFTNKKNTAQVPKPKIYAEDIPVEKKTGLEKAASGFHFSFLPVFRFDAFEDVVEKLKIYFINETHYQVSLLYECVTKNGTLFTHNTQVQPFTHFYLHDIPFEAMNEQPRFLWMLTQSKDKTKALTLNDTLKIKPRKLFEYILDLQQGGKPMFSVTLADDFPAAVNKSADVIPVPARVPLQVRKDAKKKPVYEIDLHIEKLVGNKAGLSNHDMLVIQLEAFEKALDIAISLQQQSMIVIHGVGKGRLKEEIHTILRSSIHVRHFQCDWNPRYGMGATEVFLR